MKTKPTKQTIAVPFFLIFMAVLFTNAASATVLEEKTADWSNSFLFGGTGGLENPLLRVAFNPQPEPPNPGVVLSYGHPPDPIYPPDPIITHTGDFDAGKIFRLLFGISNGSSLSINEGTLITGPGGSSVFGFEVFNNLGGAVLKVFDVHLILTTTSGGVPIDWVAFNPQPEPPRVGADGAAFGADFTFDKFSDVSLTIRVNDAQGTPITLNTIPEPTTLALISLSFVGIGYKRRQLEKAYDSQFEQPTETPLR